MNHQLDVWFCPWSVVSVVLYHDVAIYVIGCETWVGWFTSPVWCKTLQKTTWVKGWIMLKHIFLQKRMALDPAADHLFCRSTGTPHKFPSLLKHAWRACTYFGWSNGLIDLLSRNVLWVDVRICAAGLDLWPLPMLILYFFWNVYPYVVHVLLISLQFSSSSSSPFQWLPQTPFQITAGLKRFQKRCHSSTKPHVTVILPFFHVFSMWLQARRPKVSDEFVELHHRMVAGERQLVGR